MQYEDKESLEKFLHEVEKELLSNEARRKLVAYPETSILPWDTKEIGDANQALLKDASNANIYAIFTADEKSPDVFLLKYIGKTKKALAKKRLRAHLIKKSDKTGAQLEKVIEHVRARGKVKISWVAIEPESLRNYLEEELINKSKAKEEADWNKLRAIKKK